MQQVNLSDQLYRDTQRRAAEAGFSSVDDFVAELLSQEINGDTPNLDHFFTPERIALIEASEAKIEAGQFYTAEQADEELAKRRDELQRQHPAAS